MIDSYVVKAGSFEGPLDLLLSLIEKRKLFVSDISLAEVTEDYISYINDGRDTLDNISDFIAIASTLLLIKSRALLPTIDLSVEEESAIQDLSERLEHYQYLKELATEIQNIFEHHPIYESVHKKNIEVVFAPSNDIAAASLLVAIQSVIQALPNQKHWPKAVVEKVMSLEEVLDNLTERIQSGIRLSFSDVAGKGKESKVHVIVHFIALLELVKQGVIDARHGDDHDIIIETDTISVPDYH